MTFPDRQTLEYQYMEAIAALTHDRDPIVRVGLTPQQYEEMRDRWDMKDELPKWSKLMDATFWGVPCEIDEDSETGWIERRSGERTPIPGPQPGPN